MSVKRYRFRLAIPAHEYLRLYQGSVYWVYVEDAGGHSLQFPARSLQAFVSHDGVFGQFELVVDGNTNKLLELKKISS